MQGRAQASSSSSASPGVLDAGSPAPVVRQDEVSDKEGTTAHCQKQSRLYIVCNPGDGLVFQRGVCLQNTLEILLVQFITAVDVPVDMHWRFRSQAGACCKGDTIECCSRNAYGWHCSVIRDASCSMHVLGAITTMVEVFVMTHWSPHDSGVVHSG